MSTGMNYELGMTIKQLIWLGGWCLCGELHSDFQNMTLRYDVLPCSVIKVAARALFSRCGPRIHLFLDGGLI